MESANRFAGLILAAGYSSRMGAFKPLLTIGDETAMEMAAGTLRKAGIHNVIVVTGFLRERLSPILAAEKITEAFNPDFDRGMFTSIKAGIAKALSGSKAGAEPRETPEGFFLMLVDCPLVPPEVIERMIDQHREQPDAFIVPCFRGKKGHPLFIPAQYAEEILAYEGEGGLKAITNRYEDRLIRLEAGTEAVVLDMDTPEGYKELLEQYSRTGTAEFEAEGELKGKRLFLIRHGEIRQHSEKIFLGQTDIPLSGKGREQAAAAADLLKQHGCSPSRIYVSDLSRTMETAEIISSRLNPQAVLVGESRLRELSLGDWDGRFISEIREKHPEEYQKRGENLLTYKIGHNSENFYDLRYRAMKGFQHILEQEKKAEKPCGDVVIITHSGVINVILSALCHTELEDQFHNYIPVGGIVVMDYSD
ncbi:MAG: histidine phosphatase family protein [Eubacteriales bacterium]|nr:histidine phosphatase family protein [Eubacteriales bacterium]